MTHFIPISLLRRLRQGEILKQIGKMNNSRILQKLRILKIKRRRRYLELSKRQDKRVKNQHKKNTRDRPKEIPYKTLDNIINFIQLMLLGNRWRRLGIYRSVLTSPLKIRIRVQKVKGFLKTEWSLITSQSTMLSPVMEWIIDSSL